MFDADFLISLLTIIAIDIVLGGDNAIVIALASRNLPEKQRNKAIVLGTGLAVVVRVFLTAVTVYLLQIPYLLFIGGILLFFIAYNLLVEDDKGENIKGETTLFSAVKTIVFADIAMGLDNVLAIAGASHGNLLLVLIGLLVSIPIIIWGSKMILLLMEQFSFLIYIGAGILAYTASSMIVEEEQFLRIFEYDPLLKYGVQAAIISAVLLAGWMTKRLKSNRVHL
ncbi:TerC family protein [Bacillus taeanensis]|uniref:TerC family protein n=1 Tax=Bacillus taeanensis TaxID=273032 RepID=A0A366XV67_9BACI|nr:TerC family protein [Bacillus taeanensis]